MSSINKRFDIKISATGLAAGTRPWAAIVRLTPDGAYQLTHALYFPPDLAGETALTFLNAWPGDVVLYGLSRLGHVSGLRITDLKWHKITGRALEHIDGLDGACKLWGRRPAAGATMGPLDLVGVLGLGNGRRVDVSHGVPRVSAGNSELIRCTECNGTGRASSSTRLNWKPCLACHGKGIL